MFWDSSTMKFAYSHSTTLIIGLVEEKHTTGIEHPSDDLGMCHCWPYFNKT